MVHIIELNDAFGLLPRKPKSMELASGRRRTSALTVQGISDANSSTLAGIRADKSNCPAFPCTLHSGPERQPAANESSACSPLRGQHTSACSVSGVTVDCRPRVSRLTLHMSMCKSTKSRRSVKAMPVWVKCTPTDGRSDCSLRAFFMRAALPD